MPLTVRQRLPPVDVRGAARGWPTVMMRAAYPFSAIVGQEPLRIALVVNAVDPTVGGVLVRGHAGTGKSTAVRGLARLLPPLRVVDGCPFRCDPDQPSPLHEVCIEKARRGEPLSSAMVPTPLVELPLNTTEDRLAGTLRAEPARQQGDRRFEPGLLTSAHRGMLYVDGVNLLEAHLIDRVLDAVATGVSLVARSGVRVRHAVELQLVGTMVPDGRPLRPQFQDRFGLCVAVQGLRAAAERELLVRRRMEFEADPVGFAEQWAEADRALAAAISKARATLADVTISEAAVRRAVLLAVEAQAHGHRAELTTIKAARALAALAGKSSVSDVEIADAARYALPHRLEDHALAAAESADERIDQLVSGALGARPASLFPKALSDEQANPAVTPEAR